MFIYFPVIVSSVSYVCSMYTWILISYERCCSVDSWMVFISCEMLRHVTKCQAVFRFFPTACCPPILTRAAQNGQVRICPDLLLREGLGCFLFANALTDEWLGCSFTHIIHHYPILCRPVIKHGVLEMSPFSSGISKQTPRSAGNG